VALGTLTVMTVTTEPVGQQVRRWRERRRRSQLDVSTAADISTRHLSFVETGRSMPSRAMIERICDELDVPLRDRNALYLAAGFAPVHAERPLADLGVARTAVEAVLAGHEPNPALAVNVRWEVLSANRAAQSLLRMIDAPPGDEPTNVLRATLHPAGLAPRIGNYDQWRSHVVRRVRRQLERTADAGLADLLAEILSYPSPGAPAGAPDAAATLATIDQDLVIPLVLRSDVGELSLLYAVTVFGAPRDITLDEVGIETFFPADAATATLLRAVAA
jgi:transcriptional regulator with XRE-family HTH domain